MDVLDFTPDAKHFINYSYDVFHWHVGLRYCLSFALSVVRIELNPTYEQCSAFLIKRSNSMISFFMSCMSCPAKYISQIVFFRKFDIFFLRNSVVKSAIHTFCASPSRKIDAEISTSALLQLISFCISCVDFWLTLMQRRSSLNPCIPVSEVFVIPYVVVVVPFNVWSILFAFFYLSACGLLHPACHLLIFEHFEHGHFLLNWLFIRFWVLKFFFFI